MTSSQALVWYDSKRSSSLLDRLGNLGYTGVVVYPENAEATSGKVASRMTSILHCDSNESLETFARTSYLDTKSIVASPSLDVLESAGSRDLQTCYRAFVDDERSLHEAIDKGRNHDYLMVSFQDPTNIPLELVIASLQSTDTVLIKEILDPSDVDDALVTLGVMEVGADGVMFSPSEHAKLDEFISKLPSAVTPTLAIEPATILHTRPVGMGYRSCIDLATLFEPNEGMVIGSTSQGGILCCPEVFYLPYMELRPFRVNAGAVHSYVYNVNNRTDYMTELRAGSPAMIVDQDGKARRAVVGRMKTEVRPLRLIEAEFTTGARINVLLQDDWHVRIFSDDAKPRNITELKAGDKILAHLANPGRHVGIKVEENIVER